MYRKNSNYHSYVDHEVINVDALSYISMRVFFPLQYCLFTSLDSQRFNIFSHISSHNILFYLGNSGLLLDSEIGLLRIDQKKQSLFNYFDSLDKNLLNQLLKI